MSGALLLIWQNYRRRVKYLRGYYGLFVRYVKIKGPSLFIMKAFFKIYPKRKIKSALVYESNDQHIKNRINFKFDVKKLRVILCWPEMTLRSNCWMESDINFAYVQSLLELGIQPANLKSFELSYINTLLESIYESDSQILFLLDGNSISTMSQSNLQEVKRLRKLGCKVVIDHPDLLISRNDAEVLMRCLSIADLVVIHNPLFLEHRELSKMENRLILWPSFPYSSVFYSTSTHERMKSVLMSGTKYKGRDHYLSYLVQRGFPVMDKMHDKKEQGGAISSYLDYLASLESTALTFSTGYRTPKESLLTFRVVESMLRGTTVLYETGSFINYFYQPYNHYIPICNAPDLYIKGQYLLENPKESLSISRRALDFTKQHYSGEEFWRLVFERVF